MVVLWECSEYCAVFCKTAVHVQCVCYVSQPQWSDTKESFMLRLDRWLQSETVNIGQSSHTTTEALHIQTTTVTEAR